MENRKEKKTKMTIDKLAVMVADGFESVDKKFESVEKKIATKDDLLSLKLELKKDIRDFRVEFKSFKNDTNKSVQKIEEDVVDMGETGLLYDKRIEKLENKVFPELNIA